MNLIITICLIAVVVVFFLINRTPNVVEDPILDEVSPRLMQRLTKAPYSLVKIIFTLTYLRVIKLVKWISLSLTKDS